MTRAPAEVGSAANSYEILAKLAMGGMAEIFLARGASAAGVERYVVLKRVLRHRASDVHFVQMFLDEARLAAQLNHPNIAQVYDIGKLGDSYFFTMEYVHGETVRNLLSRSHGLRRAIPFSSVLSIIAGAAAGLHHAHDRKGIDGRHLGIVHRDVSPSNLMVSYEGTVKVVDFGVAKAAHRSTETISGTVKGKISYMSPEQCRGNEIDRRSDLFSLGIVMWEMLTTEKLFRRSSDFETMTAIVGDDIPPPSRFRPEIPPEIDHVVMRLLAKDPAQRFQNGDELHEAIEGVAVRTGSALSTASLGRYMRELFGQRPEPWIELQTQDQHPEAFTVTSEPIPNNLALSPAEEFDRKLSAVPALTQRLATEPDPRPPQPMIPLRVGPDLVTTLPPGRDPEDLFKTNPIERSDDPQDLMATQAIRDTGPRAPSLATVPAQQVGRATPMGGAPVMFTPDSGVVVARPHSPSVTPPSNPHYPIVTSSSHPSLSGQSPYPVAQRPQLDDAQEPKRSLAMIILIPAIAIGIVIGIALALGGGKQKQTASEHTTTMVATPEPGSASGAPAPETNAQPVPPAPETNVQPATTPPPPEPTVPVAAAGSADKPADEITMPEEPVAKPAKPDKPAADRPATKPKPEPDVAVLFKAGNYAEVVATCSSAAKVVTANATTCTVAACKAKQAAKARKWFAQVPGAKKQAVQHDCDGVIPADKPAVDPCKADPMACQH